MRLSLYAQTAASSDLREAEDRRYEGNACGTGNWSPSGLIPSTQNRVHEVSVVWFSGL